MGRKSLPKGAPAVEIRNASDALAIISETITKVRTGELDPRIASSISTLCNASIRAVEIASVEARIEKIERAMKARGGME